jgi:hypothetical protein
MRVRNDWTNVTFQEWQCLKEVHEGKEEVKQAIVRVVGDVGLHWFLLSYV